MSRRTYTGLIHLNGNLLCAIDTETTGTVPGTHDIIEIAVLPLDENLNPHPKVMPLEFTMQPKRPDNIDPEAMSVSKMEMLKIMTDGLDHWRAADLFEEWFTKLNLGYNKRLAPLAQNWAFDRGFIQEWLGPKTFDHIFDGRYRDTMCAALYDNDYADQRGEQYPYPKVNLSYLCNILQIEHERKHRALVDCVATAEVYKRILTARP